MVKNIPLSFIISITYINENYYLFLKSFQNFFSAVLSAENYCKANRLRKRGNEPGNRVGNVENFKLLVDGEDCVNPQNTQSARADERNHHRHEGAPHSARRADDCVHNSAQAIAGADVAQTQYAARNGGGVIVVNRHEDIPGEVHGIAEHESDNRNHRDADPENPHNAVGLVRAVIAPGKAERRLVHCVHSDIDKAFNALRRGVSCHSRAAEQVHRGLNKHV